MSSLVIFWPPPPSSYDVIYEQPLTCMPRRAKMKMKRKRRRSRERMDEMAFVKASTKFLKLDQYLISKMCHSLFQM